MLNSPEKVEQTIAQLQTRAALLEGEVINLKKAKISEQVSIQQLLKEKEELIEQKEALSDEISDLTKEKNHIDGLSKSTLSAYTKEEANLSEEINKLKEDKHSLEKETLEMQEKLKDSLSEISEITKEYSLVKEKVEKLQTALNTAQKALDI